MSLSERGPGMPAVCLLSVQPRSGPGVVPVLGAALRGLWEWMRRREHWRFAVPLLAFVVTNLVVAVVRIGLNNSDFDFGYHGPARAVVLDGKDPYTEYSFNSFSPFFYVLLTPLALLPSRVAIVLWNLLNVTWVVGILALLRDLAVRTAHPVKLAHPAAAPLLGLMLIFDNINLGQSNLFTLFLVVAAVYSLTVGRDGRAGLLLALAIAFKITPAVFLLYLLLKGRGRALLATAAGLVLWLVAVPSLVLGWTRNLALLGTWLSLTVAPFLRGEKVRTTNVIWYHTNQSLEAFLNRHFTSYGQERYGGWHAWLDPAFLDETSASRVALVLKVGVLLLLVALCWRAGRHAARMVPLELALFVLAALFISPVSWFNHYVGALVAYAVLLQELTVMPRDGRGFRWTAAALGMACGLTTLAVPPQWRSYSPVFLSHVPVFVALYGRAWQLASRAAV